MLLELENELKALEKNSAGADWKNREVLGPIVDDIRILCTKYAQEGKIRGFVLEVNGFDASRKVMHWPDRVFEESELSIKVMTADSGIQESLEMAYTAKADKTVALKLPVVEKAKETV